MPNAPTKPRRTAKMGRKRAEPEPGTPGQILTMLLDGLPARRQKSREKLADDADISRPRLSDILTGKVDNPGINTVDRILKAVGLTLCDYHKAAEKISENSTNSD